VRVTEFGNRRQGNATRTRANDQWRYGDVEPIDKVRVDEAGDCPCPTFDEYPLQAPIREVLKNVTRIEPGRPAHKPYDVGTVHRVWCTMPLNDDHRSATIVKKSLIARQFAATIDHDARGAGTFYFANRKAWIIILNSTDTHNHCIDQSAAAMKMGKAIRPGYVTRVSAWRRDATIQ